MEQVGSHLLALIFQFLPVKTLLRFRCLSRWHKSAIDNLDFSQLYCLSSAADQSRSSRLFLQFHSSLPSAAPVRFCPFSDRNSPGQAFPAGYSVVIRSCFGLLCVASNPFYVVLWNPSTRTHRHVIYKHHDSIDFGAYRRVSFGLGYDNKKNIKLVRLLFSFMPELSAFIGEASVYTVCNDTWQTIDYQIMWPGNSYREHRRCIYEFGKSGVSMKHIIKWVVKLSGFNQDGSGIFTIMSLNLNNHEFHTQLVPEFLMEGRSSDSLVNMDLWPFNLTICLSLHFNGESPKVTIWIWIEDTENWSKLLTVKGFAECLRPLFYSKNKRKVLLKMDSKLVWFDLQTEKYWDSNVLPEGSLLRDATAYIDSCDLIDGLGRCLRS